MNGRSATLVYHGQESADVPLGKVRELGAVGVHAPGLFDSLVDLGMEHPASRVCEFESLVHLDTQDLDKFYRLDVETGN